MALPQVNIKNKRASYEYFLIEKYSAGIQLTGTEIKSIRYSKASIKEAHCAFVGNELFIRNMNISEYKLGTHYNHEPTRERKLLLTKRELNKLKTKVSEKGFTLVPLRLFLSENGLAKLEIALAKGKHTYDKRASLKDKDQKRDLDRSTD